MLGANLTPRLQKLAVQAKARAPRGALSQQVGDYYRAMLDMRQATRRPAALAGRPGVRRASSPVDLAAVAAGCRPAPAARRCSTW